MLSVFPSNAGFKHVTQSGVKRIAADRVANIVIVAPYLGPYRLLVGGRSVRQPFEKIAKFVDAISRQQSDPILTRAGRGVRLKRRIVVLRRFDRR
jgi:hypothetical protein